MTPQELKNSILQIAIQGKLVEQRPEEGTGEELFAEIQKEKARLIKEGKLKKEKPLPEITEDEKPFEIPESWKWVRLNEIATSGLGKTLNKATDMGDLCRYLCSINVYWEGIKLDVVKEAPFSTEDKAKYLLQKGDLLVCEGGEAGRCAIWNHDEEMYYQNALHRVRFWGEISGAYFKYIFELYKGIGIIKKHCKGETIQHLVQAELFSILFPLPPFAEQKRIVAKIEELLPLIDRYEEAWMKLEAFNKRFPGDMQKSLLQMAIQGKLVEQRPEEGTGEELYQQIQAEKQVLIKAGKIKKDKPLAEITEDEKLFEIPESWRWVRFSDVAIFENGDRSSKYPVESDYVPYGIPFFGAKDMTENELSFANVRYISQEKFDDLGNGKLVDGDFICLLRGSVGKTATFRAQGEVTTGFICAQMLIIRCIEKKIHDYISVFMKTPIYASIVKMKTTGTAVRQLPAKEIANIPIPLPPIGEQTRILAKLSEIFKLYKGLE